jgi:hypothetical protein
MVGKQDTDEMRNNSMTSMLDELQNNMSFQEKEHNLNFKNRLDKIEADWLTFKNRIDTVDKDNKTMKRKIQ